MPFKINKIESYLKNIYIRILIPENYNHKCVIFSYGLIGSAPDSSNPLFYHLLHAGYACLTYDYPGCYNSRGRFSFYGGLNTLIKVIENSKILLKDLKEIILIGVSYGALLNLHAAASFNEVTKVVCVSTPYNITKLKKHLLSLVRRMKNFPVFKVAKNYLYKLEMLDFKYTPILEVKDILFIHGVHDELTPLRDLKNILLHFKLDTKKIFVAEKHLGWWIFNEPYILQKTLKFITYNSLKNILREISLRKNISIALGGLPLAGSSTVGHFIASILGFRFISLGEIYRQKTNFKKPIDQGLGVLTSSKIIGEMKKIDRKISKKAEGGGIVLDGKLSLFLTQKFKNTFKVWVLCRFDERVKRGSKKENTPLRLFESKLRKVERLERKVFQHLYGIDYRSFQRSIADYRCRNYNINKTISSILSNLLLWYKNLKNR